MKTMKTLKELAQEALDVQNACNLTGVVHGYSRAMTRLRELYPDESTHFFNLHPISILWADKIAHLTETQGFDERVQQAYTEVYKFLKGKITYPDGYWFGE